MGCHGDGDGQAKRWIQSHGSSRESFQDTISGQVPTEQQEVYQAAALLVFLAAPSRALLLSLQQSQNNEHLF